MKISQPKRTRWVYIGVILMLLALISFSILPLVSSIAQEARVLNGSSSESTQAEKALETRALGYQLVLEREPDNQNALEGLLEVRLQQGDLKKAIEPIEKLAQLNPQQTDYTILLAQAKQQVGDYEGAIAAYRTILASQPTDIQALKGMTELLLAQNRGGEAVSLVQKTLVEAIKDKAAKTDSVEAVNVTSLQLLLGEIYIEQERYSEALAVYEQAIKSNGEDFRPLLAKALILQKQGKNAEAEPIFDRAVALAPVQYKDRIKKMALGASDWEKKARAN
ncbi:cellulose synthase subunit BcsC [Hydrococcus rivularis NIES-593]|uniref:Cellulose synthase subunit BcsC n=1 Tax=Hydrococcus rivularis NIES-593 TaxID=1921803 RepID=A0A1U7HR81_9CYAN|nr:tetratricopeptide repeat protein [Hydrococcus rivularis]OKH26110.1 cellulose synthase subunit BcsC [Hydrococcus rivularis NIES-593]